METDNKILNWLGEFFKVEEDKALHENKLFWVVVLVPLFFIVWISWRLTAELITKGLYNPHVSAESLAGFVSYYAFPIALLTVPLTLAVMINRFHSSKQKAKSNRLLEDNNIANNYFSHFNSFKEYCVQLEVMHEDNGLKIFPQRLYQFIFYKSNMSNFAPSVTEWKIKNLFSLMSDEIEIYREYVEQNGYYDVDERTLNTYEHHYNLFEGLQFNCNVRSDKELHDYLEVLSDIYYDIFMFQGVLNSSSVATRFQAYYELKIQEQFKLQRFASKTIVQLVL